MELLVRVKLALVRNTREDGSYKSPCRHRLAVPSRTIVAVQRSTAAGHLTSRNVRNGFVISITHQRTTPDGTRNENQTCLVKPQHWTRRRNSGENIQGIAGSGSLSER